MAVVSDPAAWAQVIWAQDGATGSWLGYLLFPIAGILVGAAYAAYKARARGLTLLIGVCATVALAWAILWFINTLKAYGG